MCLLIPGRPSHPAFSSCLGYGSRHNTINGILITGRINKSVKTTHYFGLILSHARSGNSKALSRSICCSKVFHGRMQSIKSIETGRRRQLTSIKMHCAYLDRSLQDNLWWLADDVSGRNLYRRIGLMNKLLSSSSTLSWSSLGIVGGRGICGRKFDLESNFTLGMRWKTRVTTTTRPNLVTKLFICRDCNEE